MKKTCYGYNCNSFGDCRQCGRSIYLHADIDRSKEVGVHLKNMLKVKECFLYNLIWDIKEALRPHLFLAPGKMPSAEWLMRWLRFDPASGQLNGTPLAEYPKYRRASVACICKDCGQEYGKHHYAKDWKDWSGNPWLIRLCNYELVKL